MHALRWIHNLDQLENGGVCLLLGCGRLLSLDQLALHRLHFVVITSNLRRGQL